MLLDPADDEDPALLFFNSIGEAVCSPERDDPWEINRVNYSIDRYILNDYQPLVDKRKIIWDECWRLTQEYLNEIDTYNATGSQVARTRTKEKIKQIRSMLTADQEFSSAARACVFSFGQQDRRAMVLLRAM